MVKYGIQIDDKYRFYLRQRHHFNLLVITDFWSPEHLKNEAESISGNFDEKQKILHSIERKCYFQKFHSRL